MMTHLKTKAQSLSRLCRIELPLSAGLCVIVGELLALGHWPTFAQMILGFLSVFLLSAATLVLNDYYDLASDLVNAPTRPLPAGIVTKQEVVWFSIVMTTLGLLISLLMGWPTLLLAVVVWLTGFLYNWRLKRMGLLGNLMVSFCVGMTFIFGGVAVNRPFEKVVWLFAGLIALIDLGEEIAGDALDVPGDRHLQSSSLAIVLGAETALKISAGLFFLVIACSSLPFALGWLGWRYVLPIIVMDVGILYATLQLLNPHKADARRKYVRWVYLSGSIGLVIFLGMWLL